jgi:hypothetical protein
MPESFLHLKAQEQSQIYRALAPQLARSPSMPSWIVCARWQQRSMAAAMV